MIKKTLLFSLATASLFALDKCAVDFADLIQKNIQTRYAKNAKVKANVIETFKVDKDWKGEILSISVTLDGQTLPPRKQIIFCNEKKGLIAPILIKDKKDLSEEKLKEIKKEEIKKTLKNKKPLIKGKNGTVIVFTDPMCPYCRKFLPIVIQTAKDRGDTLYLIEIQLPYHKYSDRYEAAMIYAKERLKEKYPAFVAAVYSRVDFRGQNYEEDTVKGIFKDYNLSYSDFKKKENEYIQKAKNDFKENYKIFSSLGIKGTPTIINGAGEKVDMSDYLGKKTFEKVLNDGRK